MMRALTVTNLCLLANHGQVGGGETMLLAMADAARTAGLPATVVTPPGELAESASAMGHRVQVIRGSTRREHLIALTRWQPRPNTLVWCVGPLPAVATSGRPGRVIHLHQEPRSARHRHLMRVARLGATTTYVPSHYLAGLFPGARVMWNWSPETLVSKEPRTSSTPFRVGFCGRLSIDKGFDVLCRAIELLDAAARGSVELVVAGDNRFVPREQALQVAQASRPIAPLVRRMGWVPRARFLSEVDVVVVPSRQPEAFGLVASEAMAARVPVVVSDAGALPEVMGNGYPWVVQRGNAQALAQTLARVASSPDEMVVNSARRRWEQKFSPDAGIARFLAELEGLGYERPVKSEQDVVAPSRLAKTYNLATSLERW